jgi:hypothetical protein
MGTNKKKRIPDLVVYNEEKGYYARELTYGSNAGAPAINIEDVQGWKQNQANKANKQFKKRYDELKEEFKKLVDEVNWNELVYSAGYTFKPILGTIYHLYMRKDETMFLSLIDPNTWNQDYVGSFELDSREKWIKVEFFIK